MNLQKHLPFLAALAIVAFTFFGDAKPLAPKATGGVATALAAATRSDKASVGSVYRALSDITSRDKGRVIKTTAEWRAMHSAALKLAFADSGFVGRYKGLDVEVEKVIFPALGDKVRNMTDLLENKPIWQRVADACLEVERQCE
ncbi:MAG: hypothetical protein EBT03_08605 [Betaproteobacteria bacterium]|nr:hypothetical protein [Betaproteobacteria bacterium]NCA16935.1 hypothetical protein [Betaproteobacteria bacterium]